MYPMNAGVPMYPNCFEMLTTNGVIADDLTGFVTGTPSPYLQAYAAQRGAPYGQPYSADGLLPGQVMPDNLPNTISKSPVLAGPNTDVYQKPDITAPFKEDKTAKWKKIAAGVLLGGLAAFGLFKGIKAFKNFRAPKPTATPPPAPAAATTAPVKKENFFKRMYHKVFPKKP